MLRCARGDADALRCAQESVGEAMNKLGVQYVEEYSAENGIFRVDFALVGARKKVAIEADGPFHFTCNTRQPLGHTILRLTDRRVELICSHCG
jgi:hypothetical protein